MRNHKDILVGSLKNTASKDLENNSEKRSQLPVRAAISLFLQKHKGKTLVPEMAFTVSTQRSDQTQSLLSFLIFRLFLKESEFTLQCMWNSVSHTSATLLHQRSTPNLLLEIPCLVVCYSPSFPHHVLRGFVDFEGGTDARVLCQVHFSNICSLLDCQDTGIMSHLSLAHCNC